MKAAVFPAGTIEKQTERQLFVLGTFTKRVLSGVMTTSAHF
jgi:hypothetical protein